MIEEIFDEDEQISEPQILAILRQAEGGISVRSYAANME